MKEIYSVAPTVKYVLEHYPDTRNSDDLLYIAVCKRFNPQITDLGFEGVILNRKSLNIPKYETVSRLRRLIQKKERELEAEAEVIDGRYENFKIVKEFVGAQ